MSDLRNYDLWKTTPPEAPNQDLWDAYNHALGELTEVVFKSDQATDSEWPRVVEQVHYWSAELSEAAEALAKYAGVSWRRVEELDDRLADLVRAIENGWTKYAWELVVHLDGFIDGDLIR